MDDTNKMLTKVSSDKLPSKERGKRKKGTFLEKEPVFLTPQRLSTDKYHINILVDIFTNETHLLESVKGYSNGRIELFKRCDGIVFSNHKLNLSECDFSLPLTPSLISGKMEVVQQPVSDIPQIDYTAVENEIAVEIERDFSSENGETLTPPVENNPFSYRGFGGFSNWKMKTRKRETSSSNNKKSTKIDFEAQSNFSKIFEHTNVFYDPEILKERKTHSYLLPPDSLFTGQDLYSYIYTVGSYLRSGGLPLPEVDVGDRSFSFYNEISDHQNYIPPLEKERDDEIVNTVVEGEQQELIKTLLSTYKRVERKVNMNILKENIHKRIPTGGSKIRLSDIMGSIGEEYGEEERKGVTVHTCFISLLHLANERGISLEDSENDLIINN